MLKKAESYLKYLPIIYSILVIWGYIYLSIFYSSFGVEIAPYLEISEILLLLNKDVTLLIGTVFFAFYITLCYRYVCLCIITKIINPILKRFSRRKIYFFGIQWYFPILIYAMVNFYKEMGVLLIFITSSMLFLAPFSARFMRYPFPRLQNTLPLFIMCTILMLGGSWQFSIDRAESVRNSTISKTIVLKNKQDTIRTGGFNKFIGQTRKYVFVYDSLGNQTTVFSRSDILSISTKTPKSKKEQKEEKKRAKKAANKS